jgi:hypothetical protein
MAIVTLPSLHDHAPEGVNMEEVPKLPPMTAVHEKSV